ncbi:MAG: hypothetical protein ACQEWD_11365 [Bacteroidota bacterium]
MAVKKTIEIDVRTEESVKDVNQLTTSIQKTDKQTEATKKTTDSLTNSLDRMTGGAVTGFKNMVAGAKNGVMAMRSLKVAIAATGIGLLVVAVGSLVSYFTQTQRGADLVSKAFKGIGATVSVLIDRVSGFGEGLALIFSGKYQEGADKLKASIKGIGEEIKNESQAAWDLDEALKAVEDQEIGLIQVNAKRRAEIEKLRLESEELAKSDKEAAAEKLKQAIELENAIFESNFKIAEERARISKEQLALGESTRDEIRANEDLQARVIELATERDRRLKTVQTRLNSLLGTEKEMTEVIRQRAKVQGIGETNLTPEGVNELDIIKELEKSKFETVAEYEARKEELRKNSANAQITIEKHLRDQQIDIAGSVAGSIANILGQESKMGKAFAITQALINTYQGISAGVKLGFPAAIPAVAAAAATGFGAVKNIVSTKIPTFPGVNTGGGSSPGAPRTTTPTPSFNIIGNNTQNNQLGNAINGLNELGKRPIQTYVVGKQVTEQQELDRNIRQTASIG